MTHIVKSGDTLSKIAKSNGLTMAALLAANPALKANPNNLKVGQKIVIPDDDPAPPVVPRPSPGSTDIQLGKLSEKFETSGRGPGMVSSGIGDRGGRSYGSYQMTSKPAPGRVGEFVSQPDFVFRAEFRDLSPGSEEFTAKWKALAASRPDEFQESQHEFIKRTHFDPLVEKVKRQDGLDITTRSHALQDVVWSTAVQHGPGSAVIHLALARIDVAPDDPQFDEQLIRAIYAERGKRDENGNLARFSKNSPAVQRGVANRFKQEEKDALAMLRAELGG
ncbi:MAG: LysM peptidoglycan-binding domain-containing protein [Acidobacteria bacterium]|nr:LysM peptidoglycan-binding domain-containing protein [Acidobacteriota bacterium]